MQPFCWMLSLATNCLIYYHLTHSTSSPKIWLLSNIQQPVPYYFGQTLQLLFFSILVLVRLLFKDGYYSRVATIQGWLLFKGGIYFIGKSIDSNDWNRYMQAIEIGMIDTGSSKCSLSVLLSVKTSLRTQTGLEIAQSASAAIISTRICSRAY